jgi:hypothetical protein
MDGRGRGIRHGAGCGKGAQGTIDACKGVVRLKGFTALNFTPETIGKLKSTLERADASADEKMNAIRVLSTLVISVADLESTLIGRAVHNLASPAPGRSVPVGLQRSAAKLVEKWRAEVRARPSTAPDGHAGSTGRGAPPQATASQLIPQRLPGDICAETLRARFSVNLGGGSHGAAAAFALERALPPDTEGRRVCVRKLEKALSLNATLKTALLAGWVDPATALAMDTAALCAESFM